MKLKADMFPYPVLNRELDDYVGSDFYTKINVVQVSPSNIELTIEFHLEDDVLSRLIESKTAVYAVHLEGVSSAYRNLHKLDANETTITIPIHSSEVSRKIEVNTMIIANQDFKDYDNPNFNRDFYSNEYAISQVFDGDILAFDTMIELNFDFSNRENPNTKSMIRVASKNQKYMTVDTDGEVIQVYLPEKAHTAYINLSNSNEAKKNMLLVTVILPALSYVISQIKQEEVETERDWYIALKEMLEKLKYDINSIKTADPLKVAQELLDLPFESALYDFYQWEERANEEY